MKKAPIVGVVLVAALALTGCTGQGGGDGDAKTQLTMGVQSTPQSLDPYLSEGGGYYPYLTPTYDTLIRLDNDGGLQPSLATEWSASDDGLSFSLTLRDDVTFSDGTKFDAEAVKENIERVKTVSGPRTAQLSMVTDVTVVDDTHAVINLSTPQPAMTNILSDVLGMMVSPAAIADPDLATNPVGSGPYVFDAAESTDGDTYTYDKNPDYWDPDNYPFDSIVVRVIPDGNTMYQALVSGEIDVAGALNDQVSAAESDGLQVFKSPVNFSGLFLLDRTGTQVPALGDVRVRQAMNYAVDRKALVDAVAPGLGTPTSQWMLPGLDGYLPELDDYYTYDVKKAKQLMADAGYADGFDLTVQTAPFLGLTNQAQLIGGYLKEIGINLIIDEVQPGDFVPDLIQGHDPSAQFLWGTANAYLDAQNLVLPGSPFNPFKATDDELNSTMTEALTASDADRTKLYEDFNKRLTEQAWFLITHFQDVTLFVNNDVTNVGFWPNRATPSFYGWAPAE